MGNLLHFSEPAKKRLQALRDGLSEIEKLYQDFYTCLTYQREALEGAQESKHHHLGETAYGMSLTLLIEALEHPTPHSLFSDLDRAAHLQHVLAMDPADPDDDTLQTVSRQYDLMLERQGLQLRTMRREALQFENSIADTLKANGQAPETSGFACAMLSLNGILEDLAARNAEITAEWKATTGRGTGNLLR